ncbi:MAG: beta-propeller domain-containing protein [Deltaproteobacteria bacterium]|nr:beta-propeller domain-containing protein [Deltaproteobacteria bacterium]
MDTHTRSVAAKQVLGAILLMLALAGCTGDAPSGDEPPGPSSFETAGNAGSTGSDRSAGADAGASASPAAPPPADGAAERTVEEADIYRFVGDRLYVLNQYRGLYVFDVSNPDAPREIGRTHLEGYPVEMYVRGDRAYAILSDYYDYWMDSASRELSSFRGSRIVGLDMSDPDHPEVIGSVRLDGYVSDSRLVGDVIYAVANRYGWYGYGDTPGGEARDEMVVTSIDIADPARMRAVQRESFEGNGYYVHATSDAFVIAGVNYDAARDWGAYTDVTYLDISSPQGVMRRRGHVEVVGYMQEDTALDVHEGQLRVLTRDWNTQASKLRIFDASQPDTLPLLGELDYVYEGGLFGTTFDADRLYMVHYQTIDPLEVVDLSDPTRPVVTGILEMPGWVDRIAALGDRLVGLGIDDTDGRRVSLSLFDVSDPAAPRLLDRLSSGSEWSWSEASWERKAWTVDAEAGLVLFPYSGYDSETGTPSNHLGIVELSRDDLRARGVVESPAPVERSAIHEERVYALSQSALQVIDLRDRDLPVARATVELARNLADYAVASGAGVELVMPGVYGWYGDGTGAILRTTPLDQPDSDAELGRVEIPRGAQSILVSGTTVLAIQPNDWCGGYYGPRSGDGSDECAVRPAVTVVSIADPSRPTLVATLELPRAELPSTSTYDAYSYAGWRTSYGAPYGAWMGGSAALDLGGGRFALLRETSTSCHSLEACRAVGIEPERSEYSYTEYDGREVTSVYYYGSRYDNHMAIIDASDASAPRLRELIDLGEGRIENPLVDGDTLVFSHARPSRVDDEGRSFVRYYMERFEITDSGLLALGETNVPGVVIGLRDSGTTVLTVDRRWISPAESTTPDYYYYGEIETTLNALQLWGERAYLASSLVIGRGDSSVVLAGDHAYFIRNRYDTRWDDARDDSAGILTTVSVRDRAALREVSEQRIGLVGWSIAAQTGSTLALSGGWGAGLVLFDVGHDPEHPAFERFVRTDGWQVSIREHDGTVFLCGGPYGLQAVSLE